MCNLSIEDHFLPKCGVSHPLIHSSTLWKNHRIQKIKKKKSLSEGEQCSRSTSSIQAKEKRSGVVERVALDTPFVMVPCV